MEFEVKLELSFDEERDYIRRWVDIYSAMNLSESKWLTSREKDFFVITVWLYRHGFDLSKNKDIYPYYKEIGNFSSTKGEISGYKRALKKKGWIIATRSSITLPDIFKNFGDCLNIKVSLRNDTKKA